MYNWCIVVHLGQEILQWYVLARHGLGFGQRRWLFLFGLLLASRLRCRRRLLRRDFWRLVGRHCDMM